MFYKQFLNITDSLNPEFVEEFDYWLATLPNNKKRNITISIVSSQLNVLYSQAKAILNFAKEQGILEEYFLVKCPNDDCGLVLSEASLQSIYNILSNPIYCHNCDKEYHVSPDDIYVAYKVILSPDVPEEKIYEEIERRLKNKNLISSNFSNADSLINNLSYMYKVYYNPDESAYKELKKIYSTLDSNFKNNTTAKGNTLENLVLKIFGLINGSKVTNKLRSSTNQFDCTIHFPAKLLIPTIFDKLSPYFIIECKNEKKSPSNTYAHKLLGIITLTEAQVGILFSRKPIGKPIFDISYHKYLESKKTNHTKYLICMSDYDINKLINEKVNLLEYLDFKILQLTTNSMKITFEMFLQNKY